MTSRNPDPRKLDVAAFAADAGLLEGRCALADFERLGAGARQDAEVQWTLRGERRPVMAGTAETWLHLTAHARVGLDCQRCLQPVDWALDVKRSLRFVPGEEAAAALDDQSEDDVLELSRSLDLRDLVEDELLLALPIVPMHEQCAQPLVPVLRAADVAPAADQGASPFAALAALKRNAASGRD